MMLLPKSLLHLCPAPSQAQPTTFLENKTRKMRQKKKINYYKKFHNNSKAEGQ